MDERRESPGIGVAGVGASQPVRDALFPARRRGGLSTAAAIRNLGEKALVMSCRWCLSRDDFPVIDGGSDVSVSFVRSGNCDRVPILDRGP